MGHMKRERQRETGVTQAQAKEHLEPPEAGNGKEGSAFRAFGGSTIQPIP